MVYAVGRCAQMFKDAENGNKELLLKEPKML
jgi:hypothetical protein